MGDWLPIIDLGTDFNLNDIKLSEGFTCVSSSNGRVKCFGRNDDGQLGLGDTVNRGDGSNSMGDYLEWLDLGSDFNVSFTETTVGYGGSHSCFISNDLEVKSWGNNDYGQLGNNDDSVDDTSGIMSNRR